LEQPHNRYYYFAVKINKGESEMKKIIPILIVLVLLLIVGATTLIQAEPELIGISNLTDGELISGSFEIRGTVQNNGSISRVAVKIGGGSWKNADR
jgi:hypothetical protein